MDQSIPSRVCGRPFNENDLAQIRQEIALAQPPLRAEIARRVCYQASLPRKAVYVYPLTSDFRTALGVSA